MSGMRAPVGEYDHKEAMRENRKGWAKLGIKQVGFNVPIGGEVYLKAVAAVFTSAHLMRLIEASDEPAMQILANRRPTSTPERILLTDLEKLLEGEHKESVVALIAWSKEMEEEQRSSKMALHNGDTAALMYHYAREYAISFHIRGSYDILMYVRNGGTIPTY